MDHEISKNDIATASNSKGSRATAKNSKGSKGSKNDNIATEINISPYNWFLILDSILLLSYNKHFCEIFGQIKSEVSIRLQIALRKIKTTSTSMATCPSCLGVLSGFGTGKVCDSYCMVYVDSIPSSCDNCGTSSVTYDSVTKTLSCCDYYTYHVQSTLVSLKRKYGTMNDLVPSQPDIHKRWAHVSIPKSLHDENHFGHVPFEFFQLVERMFLGKNDIK